MSEISNAILLSQLKRIDRVDGQQPSTKPSQGSVKGPSFDSILESTEIQFSKHAAKRMQSRQIEFSSSERIKLDGAIDALQKKGAQDSLVVMGDLALIVNVPSKTVVTALTKEQMKEQVFTNIDSTILV